MKYILLALTLLNVSKARAFELGCYPAKDIWVDYPQRVPASDAWATYQLLPTNPRAAEIITRFIARRPAESQVICLSGVLGRRNERIVWRARIRPKGGLRMAKDRGGVEVWFAPEDSGRG